LLSCSWDQSIKVWDLDRWFCTHTLHIQGPGVLYMSLVGDHTLFSCSMDFTIHVWDIQRWALIQTLERTVTEPEFLVFGDRTVFFRSNHLIVKTLLDELRSKLSNVRCVDLNIRV
jgi:WD40 repeat protein